MGYLELASVVLFCGLTSATALAQATRVQDRQERPLTTLQDRRDRSAFTQASLTSRLLQQQSNLSVTGVVSLSKARARLAEEWHRLGVPPNKAQQIAAAFRADVPGFAHKSLAGKSDEDIASMIQSAINAGNYRSANQLLIDFERAKLRLSPMQPEAPES